MSKHRSLFEYEERMNKLSAIGDPLEKLNVFIPWEEIFSGAMAKIIKSAAKGPGGRPAYSCEMMLKVLILQRVYNLSDEQVEFQVNDRLSFQRFLGLDISSSVPDYSTIWKFREKLVHTNAIEEIFRKLIKYIEKQGIVMKSGSIVDATFVEVPRQRNSREDNEKIKNDEIPSDW